MDTTQRAGGVAGLIAGATFVVGMVMAATVLSDFAVDDPQPPEAVQFLVDHQAITYLWNTVIFIVFGVALVVLVLALHERLIGRASLVVRAATAFGLIWAGLMFAAGMIANIGLGAVVDLADTDLASANTVWSSLDAVQNGLGGGIEVVGGIWVLLVCWAALRSDALSRMSNYLGIGAGAAGIVTVVPAFEIVGAVFGLGLIVWFTWVGIVMLQTPTESHQGSSHTPRVHATT